MIEEHRKKIMGNVVSLAIGISLMFIGYSTVILIDRIDIPMYSSSPDSMTNGTIEETSAPRLSSNYGASLYIGAVAFIAGCIFSVGGVVLWPNKSDRN